MELKYEEFRSLYTLLNAGGGDPAFGKPWDAGVLARAVQICGVVGWDRFGDAGDFKHDSPEATEAIAALAKYRQMLYAAGGDTQAFWARIDDDDPLHRYGWDEGLGMPQLDRVAAGDLPAQPDERWLRRERNNEVLIAALTSALLGHVDGHVHPTLDKQEKLASQLELWAAERGIKGLSERTIKDKIRASLKGIASPADGRPSPRF